MPSKLVRLQSVLCSKPEIDSREQSSKLCQPVGGMGAEGLVPAALQQKGIGEAKVKLCSFVCYMDVEVSKLLGVGISFLVVASASPGSGQDYQNLAGHLQAPGLIRFWSYRFGTGLVSRILWSNSKEIEHSYLLRMFKVEITARDPRPRVKSQILDNMQPLS